MRAIVETLLSSPIARFLAQAAVIVAAARALGPVARRFGQPMVVAEVIAGILLGPSLFGWLAPSASTVLFPPSSMGFLGTVSQLGLVLFMFVVGLELDPALLRGRGRAAVAISQASILLPMLLGGGLAFALHARFASAGVALLPFALFLGVAMAITAFPVLARMLRERRLVRTDVGSLALACAAVDDVTAWCLLAFVVAVTRAAGLRTAIATTALTFAYVALMLGVVRPMLAQMARSWRNTGASQRTIPTILLLLLVSSFATEAIGIHALFGAFLLGVIVPREGDVAATLIAKVEDLVVLLFLPLFFAYSGLRTQLGLISSASTLAVTALVIAVACVAKFGGAYIAARLTGIAPRPAAAIGVLMNTRGLMELVVVNIGLDLGVISPSLFTILVLMALATTIATTPLLDVLMPARRASRDRTEHPVVVVCPVSGTPAAAIPAGASLGGSAPRVFDLRLLAPDATDSTPEVTEGDVQSISFVSSDHARDLDAFAEVKGATLVVVTSDVRSRPEAEALVDALSDDADSDAVLFVDRGLGRRPRSALVVLSGVATDLAAQRIADRLREAKVIVEVLARPSEARWIEGGFDLVVADRAIEHALALFPALALIVRSRSDIASDIVDHAAEPLGAA